MGVKEVPGSRKGIASFVTESPPEDIPAVGHDRIYEYI